MKQWARIFFPLFFGGVVCISNSCLAEANYIVLESSIGENYVMAVQPQESFQEVIVKVQQTLVNAEIEAGNATNFDDHHSVPFQSDFRMQVLNDGNVVVKCAAKKLTNMNPNARSYAAGLAASDKNDIAFIVKTLANESLIKIKKSETALKKAGDRVDHVHPLQFLWYVFSEEELKVGVRNIQGRSWVGSSFMNGLTKTIQEENSYGNIMPHVHHFASRLNIDPNTIIPMLKAGHWEKFVDALIKIIPRSGDADRYDM